MRSKGKRRKAVTVLRYGVVIVAPGRCIDGSGKVRPLREADYVSLSYLTTRDTYPIQELMTEPNLVKAAVIANSLEGE